MLFIISFLWRVDDITCLYLNNYQVLGNNVCTNSMIKYEILVIRFKKRSKSISIELLKRNLIVFLILFFYHHSSFYHKCRPNSLIAHSIKALTNKNSFINNIKILNIHKYQQKTCKSNLILTHINIMDYLVMEVKQGIYLA